jgi:hypothetical protein
MCFRWQSFVVCAIGTLPKVVGVRPAMIRYLDASTFPAPARESSEPKVSIRYVRVYYVTAKHAMVNKMLLLGDSDFGP